MTLPIPPPSSRFLPLSTAPRARSPPRCHDEHNTDPGAGAAPHAARAARKITVHEVTSLPKRRPETWPGEPARPWVRLGTGSLMLVCLCPALHASEERGLRLTFGSPGSQPARPGGSQGDGPDARGFRSGETGPSGLRALPQMKSRWRLRAHTGSGRVSPGRSRAGGRPAVALLIQREPAGDRRHGGESRTHRGAAHSGPPKWGRGWLRARA